MNLGKTLFAQVMEFVPWKTFGRIVERHQGTIDADGRPGLAEQLGDGGGDVVHEAKLQHRIDGDAGPSGDWPDAHRPL